MNNGEDRSGAKVLAVHSVEDFVLGVPDLEQAAHFYASFGLDVRREGATLGLYTFGHAHRWGRVLQRSQKRLLWVTFGIYPEDVAGFERKISAQGLVHGVPPEHADPSGIWLNAPDGLPVQLIVAEKTSPSTKSQRHFAPEFSNRGRAPRRSNITQVRPSRLSHILLFTPDVSAALRFYSELLGLRLSDRSGDIIAFMHTPHGSDHHLIAMAKSDNYGLHHSSWDVSSFDEVGLGSQQMAQAGYGQGWGLGRHVLGSNYFRYIRDPWGSYAEYSFDIDFIDSNVEWPAGDYPPEDSLYVWGPDLPPDFVQNYENASSDK
jgi:catechol 2,3-dioxygenase-like lactoylglutathione lyase family enzyme